MRSMLGSSIEVRCLGCDTHQTVALDIVRRPKSTPIHELERYMRCKDSSQVRSDMRQRPDIAEYDRFSNQRVRNQRNLEEAKA